MSVTQSRDLRKRHASEVTIPPDLWPYTPAWALALATINPLQAQWTMHNAPRPDGVMRCCVCGDTDRVAVYRALDGGSPRHLLLPFCDDCRFYQATMYGGRYVRVTPPAPKQGAQGKGGAA